LTSGVHILRHSFCSHLAMRGAPVRAIQELAGHADLSTTMHYMHLSPASLNQAIRLLEQRSPLRGEKGESGTLRRDYMNNSHAEVRRPAEPSRIPWAELQIRVFREDVLASPGGGRRVVLAYLTQPGR
jgi:hypothetical protein